MAVRARKSDQDGFVERDGVKIGYEVFGAGEPTLLLLCSWAIVNSRQWKAQVPYLARHFRVVTVDGRGNGRSDRPADPEAYADTELVADALAVLDATATERAVVVGLSLGGRHALMLAADHPQRVDGVVALGAALPWPAPLWFDDVRDSYEGFEKFNRHYWRRDFRDFAEVFMSAAMPEPHSTKPIEDGVGWAMQTSAETLIATVDAPGQPDWADAEAICRRVRCPVLVVHGERDAIVPYETGVTLAEWTGGELVAIRDGGHAAPFRDPVKTNLLLRDFADSVGGRRAAAGSWTRAHGRRKRVLFLSSPIGLGHARRDVAIADALRKRHPDVEIEWLAQHPVTVVLGERGERVHPASGYLASESGHIESEAGEHDLHVFEAFRRMDEILVANFMVVHDLMTAEHYDLVVGDEAWDVDHFLHENPELKRGAFAWLTDFVGMLPMPDGGAAESALTADYNAEMVEHVARYPRLRDRSIFVGNPDDLVGDPLGPGLPSVAEWTRAHFDFAGYVSGFEPPSDREALRAELGYRPGEPVCVVTVGGSGVGLALLRKIVTAYPAAARRVPGLRMVVATGPRIDPGSLPAPGGVEVCGYLPELYRHLAACDLAVVQGGLTTTMELTATARPFLYFPLARHFEQQVHVPHRLGNYRAGRRMDYAATDPDQLTDAIATGIGRPVDYRPVETGGADNAAALLAELL
ncbi:MAG: alpha/beta fold hydrolase [Pseudonocardiaceae bacterium]|nr:alpha/beta fold hydrolase [Pseudonocardiaceae bacterium]